MIRYIIVIGLCILSMLMYCANDGFDIAEDIIDAIRDHINEQHIYIYIYDGKRYTKRTVRIENGKIVYALRHTLQEPLWRIKDEAKDRKLPYHAELERLLMYFYPNLELLYTDLKAWADRYNHANENEQEVLEQSLNSELGAITLLVKRLQQERTDIKNRHDKYEEDRSKAERDLTRKEISTNNWFGNLSTVNQTADSAEIDKLCKKYK